MKKTATYFAVLGMILILGGFGCKRKTEEVVSEPVVQPTIPSQDIVPPPPEVIADIQQEGYSEKQKQYLEIINEAPNQDIDYFQAELGL